MTRGLVARGLAVAGVAALVLSVVAVAAAEARGTGGVDREAAGTSRRDETGRGAVPAAEARGTAGVAGKAAAAALPEATEVEKARALAAVGIVADSEWIILPDRGFVSRLLTDAKSAPLLEVRAVARAALDVDGSE